MGELNPSTGSLGAEYRGGNRTVLDSGAGGGFRGGGSGAGGPGSGTFQMGSFSGTGRGLNSTPVGRIGNELRVSPGTNQASVINGRTFTGHALDRMQGRGLVPSVVEDTIRNGVVTAGRGGSTIYTSNQARVILNPNGSVKTVIPQGRMRLVP